MTYKPYNPAGHRIEHIEIGGTPLQLDKMYRIAGGGEQIFKAHQNGRIWLGLKAHDALKIYFAEKKEVTVDDKPRIVCI
jgi:sulfur-oxidizing protein SoxB